MNPHITPEGALQLLRRYFLCRDDQVAFLAPWGKPSPTPVDGQLDALLACHVRGEAPEVTVRYRTPQGEERTATGGFRIGSYTPAVDGTTRWLCLDFDGGPDHANRLDDPTYAATVAWANFGAAGLPTYLERSGGGHGWHLWCFFDPPIPAAKARRLAAALLPAQVKLASGEQVAGDSGRGIEIFPKQNTITPDGFGNMVWLPWWAGAEGDANQFHSIDGVGEPQPYVPEAFETVTEAQVDAALARLGVNAPTTSEEAPEGPSDEPAGNEAWRQWRQRALDALPLTAVYGGLLTGKVRSAGWLECRDPWSASGDRDPSAGVADGTGRAERATFHSFISGKSLSVFDFLVERGEAADFESACAKMAELSGVPLPAISAVRPDADDVEHGPRPQILVNNRQLRDIITDAWGAVHTANKPPALFRRSGGLVRLVEEQDGEDNKKVLRIDTADEAAVHGLLARCADWVKGTDHGPVAVCPHRDVARDMLAYPDRGLPVLETIVTTPVFGREGQFVAEPGYHESERLWLQPTGRLGLAPVPAQPTADNIAAARSLLLDHLLVDFPFVSESDRTHAIAAMILPFVRRMIRGCTPIHLFEAPTTGTGKGLLCNLISIVTTGSACDGRTLPTQEDEARKMITAELSKGRAIILLDNTKERRTLDCPPLASVITATSWTDRLLGQSTMLTLPNRALWIVTGNNPKLSMETARRCVRVRMDARIDRPWLRNGFKHDPIMSWAQDNRSQLVHAVFVLVQAWLAAGRPLHQLRLGSFEHWSAVMGGILQVAGIAGFLGSLGELYETADAEGGEWREFVAMWWDAHQDQWVSARDLLQLVLERDLLADVIGDKSPQSQRIRLGKALTAVRDRQFDLYRVVMRRDAHTKSAGYRLLPGDACDGDSLSQAEQQVSAPGLFELGDIEDDESDDC